MAQQDPLIAQLIEAFRALPSIGQRSAQRMAYHLLQENRQAGLNLAKQLTAAMEGIHGCEVCRDFSSQPVCRICSDAARRQGQVCVVESPADCLAFEQTGVFHGRYFVLMGHLSPLDGVGPDELGLDLLQKQLASGEIEELIIATSSTLEGEATARFLVQMAGSAGVKTSRIAQGVPLGGELGFVDGMTLAHALSGRRPV
jgi:recombination protein RecR